MTSLKPCPFCGGEARHYAPGPIEHHIECTNPKCYAVTHGWSTEAEAIAAWNTRAELGSGTCENVAREWEKTSFAHAGTSFCCSECGAHYVDAECYYAGLADKDEEQIRTNYCPNCGREVVGG